MISSFRARMASLFSFSLLFLAVAVIALAAMPSSSFFPSSSSSSSKMMFVAVSALPTATTTPAAMYPLQFPFEFESQTAPWRKKKNCRVATDGRYYYHCKKLGLDMAEVPPSAVDKFDIETLELVGSTGNFSGRTRSNCFAALAGPTKGYGYFAFVDNSTLHLTTGQCSSYFLKIKLETMTVEKTLLGDIGKFGGEFSEKTSILDRWNEAFIYIATRFSRRVAKIDVSDMKVVLNVSGGGAAGVGSSGFLAMDDDKDYLYLSSALLEGQVAKVRKSDLEFLHVVSPPAELAMRFTNVLVVESTPVILLCWTDDSKKKRLFAKFAATSMEFRGTISFEPEVRPPVTSNLVRAAAARCVGGGLVVLSFQDTAFYLSPVLKRPMNSLVVVDLNDVAHYGASTETRINVSLKVADAMEDASDRSEVLVFGPDNDRKALWIDTAFGHGWLTHLPRRVVDNVIDLDSEPSAYVERTSVPSPVSQSLVKVRGTLKPLGTLILRDFDCAGVDIDIALSSPASSPRPAPITTIATIEIRNVKATGVGISVRLDNISMLVASSSSSSSSSSGGCNIDPSPTTHSNQKVVIKITDNTVSGFSGNWTQGVRHQHITGIYVSPVIVCGAHKPLVDVEVANNEVGMPFFLPRTADHFDGISVFSNINDDTLDTLLRLSANTSTAIASPPIFARLSSFHATGNSIELRVGRYDKIESIRYWRSKTYQGPCFLSGIRLGSNKLLREKVEDAVVANSQTTRDAMMMMPLLLALGGEEDFKLILLFSQNTIRTEALEVANIVVEYLGGPTIWSNIIATTDRRDQSSSSSPSPAKTTTKLRIVIENNFLNFTGYNVFYGALINISLPGAQSYNVSCISNIMLHSAADVVSNSGEYGVLSVVRLDDANLTTSPDNITFSGNQYTHRNKLNWRPFSVLHVTSRLGFVSLRCTGNEFYSFDQVGQGNPRCALVGFNAIHRADHDVDQSNSGRSILEVLTGAAEQDSLLLLRYPELLVFEDNVAVWREQPGIAFPSSTNLRPGVEGYLLFVRNSDFLMKPRVRMGGGSGGGGGSSSQGKDDHDYEGAVILLKNTSLSLIEIRGRVSLFHTTASNLTTRNISIRGARVYGKDRGAIVLVTIHYSSVCGGMSTTSSIDDPHYFNCGHVDMSDIVVIGNAVERFTGFEAVQKDNSSTISHDCAVGSLTLKNIRAEGYRAEYGQSDFSVATFQKCVNRGDFVADNVSVSGRDFLLNYFLHTHLVRNIFISRCYASFVQTFNGIALGGSTSFVILNTEMMVSPTLETDRVEIFNCTAILKANAMSSGLSVLFTKEGEIAFSSENKLPDFSVVHPTNLRISIVRSSFEISSNLFESSIAPEGNFLTLPSLRVPSLTLGSGTHVVAPRLGLFTDTVLEKIVVGNEFAADAFGCPRYGQTAEEAAQQEAITTKSIAELIEGTAIDASKFNLLALSAFGNGKIDSMAPPSGVCRNTLTKTRPLTMTKPSRTATRSPPRTRTLSNTSTIALRVPAVNAFLASTAGARGFVTMAGAVIVSPMALQHGFRVSAAARLRTCSAGSESAIATSTATSSSSGEEQDYGGAGFEDNELGFDSSPLALRIGTDKLATFRGACIGNVLAVAIIIAVLGIIVVVVKRVQKLKEWRHAVLKVRLPGSIGPGILAVGLPACLAFATLLSAPRGPSAGDVFIAIVAIAAFLLLPAGALCWITYQCQREGTSERLRNVPPPRTQSQRPSSYSSSCIETSKRQCVAIFNYFMHPWQEWRETTFCKSYGIVAHDSYSKIWFSLVDFGVAAITGIASGVSMTCRSASCCSGTSIICLALAVLHLATLAVTQPFMNRFDVGLNALMSASSVAGCALVVAELYGQEVGSALDTFMEFALSLSFVAIIASFEPLFSAGAKYFLKKKRGRRHDDEDEDDDYEDDEYRSNNNNDYDRRRRGSSNRRGSRSSSSQRRRGDRYPPHHAHHRHGDFYDDNDELEEEMILDRRRPIPPPPPHLPPSGRKIESQRDFQQRLLYGGNNTSFTRPRQQMNFSPASAMTTAAAAASPGSSRRSGSRPYSSSRSRGSATDGDGGGDERRSRGANRSSSSSSRASSDHRRRAHHQQHPYDNHVFDDGRSPRSASPPSSPSSLSRRSNSTSIHNSSSNSNNRRNLRQLILDDDADDHLMMQHDGNHNNDDHRYNDRRHDDGHRQHRRQDTSSPPRRSQYRK